MALGNILGITDSAELARVEEQISKKKAAWLFESGRLDELTPGSFEALSEIHRVLFGEIYDFAGSIRTVNIAKGDFRFAPVMYLESSVEHIEKMPQSNFDESLCPYNGVNSKIILYLFLGGTALSGIKKSNLNLTMSKSMLGCASQAGTSGESATCHLAVA